MHFNKKKYMQFNVFFWSQELSVRMPEIKTKVTRKNTGNYVINHNHPL